MGAPGAIVFLSGDGNQSPMMLEHILFDPAAVWLRVALQRQGVQRFFVVCDARDRPAVAQCFPEQAVIADAAAQDTAARLAEFLSHVSTVFVFAHPVFPGEDEREVCGKVYTLSDDLRARLWDGRADIFTLQSKIDGRCEAGFLALTAENVDEAAPQIVQRGRQKQLRQAGVRIIDPASTFVGPEVEIGVGTVLLPGTILRGQTRIGTDCEIGPNTMVCDCVLGDRVTVNASQLYESTVEDETTVGPFAYVRPHCHIGRAVKVGDFVELKNSTIGAGTKISHLTYVGDSDVGQGVNFGCGTVTVNYDGDEKHRTTIGDGAFIGCNTNLIAPVQVGDGAYTAAGSTITQEVPARSLAIARARQTIKEHWMDGKKSNGT
ncbi:MAG: UDP-N-acetylglucosamine diphosphorylase [Oscillospiraceae bacterium]|nr:UDP-N-acetylglucosamine diphosphorylase [Oscillospiraceae bacterium]